MIHCQRRSFWPCLQLPVNNCLLSGFHFHASLLNVGQLRISGCRDLSSPLGILTTFSKILISPCLPACHQCKLGQHLLLQWHRILKLASLQVQVIFFQTLEWKRMMRNTHQWGLETGNTANTVCTDVTIPVSPGSFLSAPGMNQYSTR